MNRDFFKSCHSCQIANRKSLLQGDENIEYIMPVLMYRSTVTSTVNLRTLVKSVLVVRLKSRLQIKSEKGQEKNLKLPFWFYLLQYILHVFSITVT